MGSRIIAAVDSSATLRTLSISPNSAISWWRDFLKDSDRDLLLPYPGAITRNQSFGFERKLRPDAARRGAAAGRMIGQSRVSRMRVYVLATMLSLLAFFTLPAFAVVGPASDGAQWQKHGREFLAPTLDRAEIPDERIAERRARLALITEPVEEQFMPASFPSINLARCRWL